jgi:DNA-binding PadR family transcriptional regulator
MTDASADPGKRIPLTPAVFHILLALIDQERHGYAIMQQVVEDTRGQLHMGPGTLYGSIKRMLATNLIEESERRPDPADDDVRRRYYRLTDLGRRVIGAEAVRLERAVKIARHRSAMAPKAKRREPAQG